MILLLYIIPSFLFVIAIASTLHVLMNAMHITQNNLNIPVKMGLCVISWGLFFFIYNVVNAIVTL
jgi:dipeptide/tripeptide permease